MYHPSQQDQSSVYFTLLVILQVVILIFGIVSLQNDLTMFTILRIIMLAGAKCMQSTSWMVQYIIFALICALLSFDPVGLWISGHGERRNGGQNAMCVVVFLCLCVAVYVGYLFKASFEKKIGQGLGNGESLPQGNAYRQPERVHYLEENQAQFRGFHQFSGQGHSLQ